MLVIKIGSKLVIGPLLVLDFLRDYGIRGDTKSLIVMERESKLVIGSVVVLGKTRSSIMAIIH